MQLCLCFRCSHTPVTISCAKLLCVRYISYSSTFYDAELGHSSNKSERNEHVTMTQHGTSGVPSRFDLFVAEITAAYHLTFQGAVLQERDDHFRLHVVPTVAQVRVGREFLRVRWPSPYCANLLCQNEHTCKFFVLGGDLTQGTAYTTPKRSCGNSARVCGTSTSVRGWTTET